MRYVTADGDRQSFPLDPVAAGSYWAATCPPQQPDETLTSRISADLCVIGAGFTGLSAALHAAEQGLSVVVLEAHTPGWGASGRNGGQVIPVLKLSTAELTSRFGANRAATLEAFASGAADLVFELSRKHRIECAPVRAGWIRAAHDPSKVESLLRAAESSSHYGKAIHWLEREELAARVGTDNYPGGLLDTRGGCVHPLAFALGLARAARSAGAGIYAHSPVCGMERVGQGRWRLRTPDGEVVSTEVLVATNAYTEPNLPRGLSDSITPVMSHLLATRPLPPALRARILPAGEVISDTSPLVLFYRMDAAGHLIAGYTARGGDNHGASALKQVLAAVTAFLPVERDDVTHFWSGRVAVTKDHLPHIQELAPGLNAVLGFNGRGVAMATALGKLAAARIGDAADADSLFPAGPFLPWTFPATHRRLISLGINAYGFVDQWRNLVKSWRTRVTK